MPYSDRNYVYATPRHFRAVYFIEHNLSSKVLTKIMQRNLTVWGGRYNPIIPVKDNKVDDKYLELIKPLDPDTIFYSSNLDIEEIKNQVNLRPEKFEKMDDRGHPTCGGVDSHFLIDDSIREFMDHSEKLPVLNIQESWNIDLVAKDFYETNFALFDLYAGQSRFISSLDVLEITKGNHAEINKIITEKRPYFKSILSQLKLNTCIFRATDFSIQDRFEMIISDESNPNEDLFYFWNRQQYKSPNTRLGQIIVSKQDLDVLIVDPFFEGVLHQLNSHIYLTSWTILDDELKQIQSNLQKGYKHIRFEIIRYEYFPFDILDSRYHNELPNEKEKQIIQGKKDLLKIPTPKLTNRFPQEGGFAIDVEIEYDRPGESPAANLKYPNGYYINSGRVNKSNNQTLFVNHKIQSIDFRIPEDFELFRHRLQLKGENRNNLEETEIKQLRFSSAGQKLNALIALFNNNWTDMMSFIEDKFWLDVLRHSSDFNKKQSNIPKGKGVFSHKDLINERTLLYTKYRDSIEKKLRIESAELDVDKTIESYIRDDFEWEINDELQSLVDISGVYIGLKVKCERCGSNKWYSLKELSDQLPCKGCNNRVIPQIESPLYYRVNEIITNNLLNDITSNSKDFNGNYIVLSALQYLKMQSQYGFSYCSPLDYRDSKRWAGDIDIIALQDGKLIVGEAKNDAKDFGKEIKPLSWLANTIEPDAVVLAYNTGKLSQGRIDKLRELILSKDCEIIPLKISQPWYKSGGLWGLP